jgi:hypothetical protein
MPRVPDYDNSDICLNAVCGWNWLFTGDSLRIKLHGSPSIRSAGLTRSRRH